MLTLILFSRTIKKNSADVKADESDNSLNLTHSAFAGIIFLAFLCLRLVTPSREVTMDKTIHAPRTSEFFSSGLQDDIAILKFRGNPLLGATDLHTRDVLLDQLERIDNDDTIRAVILIGSLDKTGSADYIDFYRQVVQSKIEKNAMHRLFNVIDQMILKLVEMKKIVIHVDSGKVISLFLNISLACDYRIVAHDTIFENAYLKLGMVPKGAGAFFLAKRFGSKRAFEFMFSADPISADKALALGIIDELAAKEELQATAVRAAKNFGCNFATSAAGIKRLVNFSLRDLRQYLELENQEILRIVSSSAFRQRILDSSLDLTQRHCDESL
jgi:enoyl-CoA hydratase/carnithine racemase